MQVSDFVYDGVRLSDFGMTVGYLGSPDENVSIGNEITLNRVRASRATKYMTTGYQYDDVLTAVIQIIKDPCVGDDYDMEITELEEREIMRWLNRKRNCKFTPIYDDGAWSDTSYYGTFNVQAMTVGSTLAGFELTLMTNAPFGYAEEVEYTHSFTPDDSVFVLWDTSDEIGYLYADAVIECVEGGTLSITNELDPGYEVKVANCTAGEKLHLNGELKTVKVEKGTHAKIYNDFNYNFLRIANFFGDMQNRFKASIKCNLTVTYYPVRKAGLIL